MKSNIKVMNNRKKANPQDMGYLYLLELSSKTSKEVELFYKIGICNKGVTLRYKYSKDLKYRIKVLMEIPILYEKAKEIEKIIKKVYYNHLYTPLHPFAGSKTECFNIQPCITTNYEHFNHIYEAGEDLLITPNPIKSSKLDVDITYNLEEIPEYNNIELIQVDKISEVYKVLFKQKILGYNTILKNKEVAVQLCNFIVNISMNKITRNGDRFSYYMSQNMRYHLHKDKEYNYMLRGSLKLINPVKDKYKTRDIFIFESFHNPNWKGENYKYHIHAEFKNIINSFGYCKDYVYRLYFVHKDALETLNTILHKNITYVDWLDNTYILNKKQKL